MFENARPIRAGRRAPAVRALSLLTADVDETRHQRYWVEAFNGVPLRMALLSLILGAAE